MSPSLPRPNLVALAVVGLFLGTLGLNALPLEAMRRGAATAEERTLDLTVAVQDAEPKADAEKSAEAKPAEEKSSDTKQVAKPSAKPAGKPAAKPASKPTTKPAPKRPAKKSGDGDDAGRAAIDPQTLEFVRPIEASDDDDPLLKKMKERHNLAAKLLETRVAEYRQNLGNVSHVLEAARIVVDAKLDLASDQEARLAVLQQALGVAERIEKHYQLLSDEGLGSISDLQRARLARATVEVQILKLQQQAP